MLSIGMLSRKTNVKIPTIRYYEEIGLMNTPGRTTGGQRRYETADLERLGFIRHARDLGLGIAAISDLLRLSANGDSPCADADRIAAQHLTSVKEKIKHLRKLEKELKRIVANCHTDTVGECYVIQSMGNHGMCVEEH